MLSSLSAARLALLLLLKYAPAFSLNSSSKLSGALIGRLLFLSSSAYELLPLRSCCFRYPLAWNGREREPYASPEVRALTAPKKSAARGLSVGRQAAAIPTFSSILDAVVSYEERITGNEDAVLLPDVVPSASAGPVGFFEEMVLEGDLVDGCSAGTVSCQQWV